MNRADHIILGVHITDRLNHVDKVQQVLTEFGSNIKTRLGLHEVSDDKSSPNGLLILELIGDAAKCGQLGEKLNAIDGVDTKKMVFAHD